MPPLERCKRDGQVCAAAERGGVYCAHLCQAAAEIPDECPDIYERRLRTDAKDPELQTIDFARQLLDRCSPETTYRVLTYLVDRFGPTPQGGR